jgi:hypothetical protein
VSTHFICILLISWNYSDLSQGQTFDLMTLKEQAMCVPFLLLNDQFVNDYWPCIAHEYTHKLYLQ